MQSADTNGWTCFAAPVWWQHKTSDPFLANRLRKGDFEEPPYIWQPWLLDQESRWTFASRRQFLCGEISISSLCPAHAEFKVEYVLTPSLPEDDSVRSQYLVGLYIQVS